jgi:hypothetical protein
VAKELSQPEQRSYRSFYDQHDRQWGAPVDKRTGHSVGPWEPKFQAPWLPEAKYIKHVPTDDRLIRIDYESNILDLKRAMDAYDDLRLKTAMDQYGSAFTSKLGQTAEEDPPELKRLVGKPPFPAAFPEAAKEGNRWVLGFESRIPKWAYPYLDADEEVEKAVDLDERFDPEATGGKRKPVSSGRGKSKYTAFVKDAIATGQARNIKEAAQLWNKEVAASA